MTECIENTLFLACYSKNPTLTEECLQNGYNPNTVNQYRSTPLSEAILVRDFASAKLLLAHKADAHHLNIWDCTPFFNCPDDAKHIFDAVATAAPDLSCCESLMSDYAKEIYAPSGNHPIPSTESEINQRDLFGYTPLIWSVWYGRKSDFQHCLDTGADINKPASNGATALMVACQKNRADMFWKLIELGADPSPLDANNNSALTYSLRTHFWFDPKVSDYLAKNTPATTNSSSKKSSLTWSAIMDVPDLLDFSLQQNEPEINRIDDEGNTALAYASYWGCVLSIDKLLENGAEVDLFDESRGGKPPLLWAIIGKHLHAVTILVQKGANVNHIDSQTGNSAIFYATLYTDVKITKLLREKGADPEIRNKNGVAPIENALTSNNKKLIAILQEN